MTTLRANEQPENNMTTSEEEEFAKKSALRIKIIQIRFAKKLKNIICGARERSQGTKRFRPGKGRSTLKKHTKQIANLKAKFLKTGLGVAAWRELYRQVVLQFSCCLPEYLK